MRILLAIADAAERARWDAVLRERGHVPVTARPGADARRQAAAGGLDLVIALHDAGDGDALQLLAALRDAALPPPRPGLLVQLPPEASELLLPLLQAGADDVVIGPPDAATLRLRIVAAERRHERRQPGAPSPTPVPAVAAAPVAPAGTPPAGLAPLGEALHEATEAVAAAYYALPDDPAAARHDLRTAIEALRAVQRAAEALHGPLRPVPPRPARPAASAPTPTPASERPIVVLAEDDEHVRRPLRRTLEHIGLDVLEAPDGEAALRLVLDHGDLVRLVVTDHRMPRMTGGELARELKRRTPQLPVVIVSGHGADEIAAESGADAWLRKPFQLVELARTARRLLGTLPP